MIRPKKDMTTKTTTREQLLALLQEDNGLRALLQGICPPRCIMVGDAENGYDAGHGRTDEDGMESAEAIHG